MIRHECLELLAGKMTDQLVVTSQSGQRIEWSHLSKHEGNLLVGMMGCAIGVATRIGFGVAAPQSDCARFRWQRAALALQPRDSGKSSAKNLVIYVFDNGVYSGSRISYAPRLGQYGFDRNGARRGYRQCAHDSRHRRI
jgi:hypothetical protein